MGVNMKIRSLGLQYVLQSSNLQSLMFGIATPPGTSTAVYNLAVVDQRQVDARGPVEVGAGGGEVHTQRVARGPGPAQHHLPRAVPRVRSPVHGQHVHV